MFGDVQYMKKGVVYRIKNRKTNNYLNSSPQVTTQSLHSDKISQLWLFDEIKPTLYEIVSMQSGHVLSRRQNLVIEKGNWSSCQFWKLTRAEMDLHHNYFWIVSSENQNQYLFGSAASQKVNVKNFDRTLFVSNWEIQEVDLDKDLKGCCVFKSAFSGFVIDVPQGSNKQGVNIIQYTFNGRGNQRWVLEKINGSFVIRNLCSNMILSPQARVSKAGVKIVQTQFSNKNEEKWIFEKQGQPNRYTIRNQADKSLYLGVASNRQSAQLQLTSQKQKGTWALEGSFSVIQNQN